jgi:tetratricopeptide (TPR) repeat protein
LAGDLGMDAAAVAASDQAIAYYRQAIAGKDHPLLIRSLVGLVTTAYRTRVDLATKVGDARMAVSLFDQAIAYLNEMVGRDGSAEMTERLSRMHWDKANLEKEMGDYRAALTDYDYAIALYGRVIQADGLPEHLYNLASLVANKALVLRRFEEVEEAVRLLERAMSIFESVAEMEGMQGVISDLTRTRVFRAHFLHELGRDQAAREQAATAVSAIETEMSRSGDTALQDVLSWAIRTLGDLA